MKPKVDWRERRREAEHRQEVLARACEREKEHNTLRRKLKLSPVNKRVEHLTAFAFLIGRKLGYTMMASSQKLERWEKGWKRVCFIPNTDEMLYAKKRVNLTDVFDPLKFPKN